MTQPYKSELNFLKEYLQTERHKIDKFVFGSLGWNELVVVTLSNDIKLMSDGTFWTEQPELGLHLHKTQSFMCLNNVPELKPSGYGCLEKAKNAIPDTTSNGVQASLYVATVPECCKIIHNALANHGFHVQELVGKDDFVAHYAGVDVEDLARFVMQFRSDYSDRIVSTSTVMTHKLPECTVPVVINPVTTGRIADAIRHRLLIKKSEVDVNGFREALLSSSTPHVKFIFGKIATIFPNDNVVETLQNEDILIQLVNSLIFNTNLYEKEYYDDAILSEETSVVLESLKYGITDEFRIQANRMILEDIFSDFIRRYPGHLISYRFEYLKVLYHKTVAIKLANHINSLNGLLQNELLCETFFDIRPFVNYAIRQSQNIDDDKERNSYIANATELIEAGAELRLYGTYGSIEDTGGQFVKMKGGIQRFLLAIEAIIHSLVLRSTGGFWEGFVIADVEKFAFDSEVIKVPVDSLWKPVEWWPVYHEVGHLLCNWTSVTDQKNWQVRRFLAGKTGAPYWVQFLSEIAADIFNFEAAFFGRFDLYQKSFFQRYQVSSGLHDEVDLPEMLMRMYVVNIYHEHFVNNAIPLEQLNDIKWCYENIASFILTAQKNYRFKLSPARAPEFIAAEKKSFISEIYDWLKYLHMKCCQLKLIDSPCVSTSEFLISSAFVHLIQTSNTPLYRYIQKNILKNHDALLSYNETGLPSEELLQEIVDVLNLLILEPSVFLRERLHIDEYVPFEVQQQFEKSNGENMKITCRTVIDYLLDGLIERYQSRTTSKIEDPNTKAAFDRISSGQVYNDEIVYPEAVLFLIMKSEHVKFRHMIALVLSLSDDCRHRINTGRYA